MISDAHKAVQYETEFLAGVATKLEEAKGRQLRGQLWETVESDDAEELRRAMHAAGNYDRAALRALPSNRRVSLRGYERRLLFWKRRTGVAVASTLSPVAHYAQARQEAPPPAGLPELREHVRKLIIDPTAPHLIGVCSPTGFTAEARATKLDFPNATVVLVEPDGHGGWKIGCADELADPRVLKLFDPENERDKIARVRAAVQESSADLLTGSLSVSSTAARLGLAPETVRRGFEEAAKADPELKLTRRDGEWLLFRGAPAPLTEKKSMGVIDRIRQLLSGEGDEAAKINLLTERRAALAVRRDRIYEDIAKLETKEADLLAQGKASTSPVPKRRIAAQLAQLRKDIARQNATAAMLNQQINIISTDIHNLTLIQQGEAADLPDTEELTDNAVKAEEMLETLKTDADLVGSLETGLHESLTSADELEILKELEGEVEEPSTKEPTVTQRAPAQPQRQAAPAREPASEFEPPPPPDAARRKAGPEPT